MANARLAARPESVRTGPGVSIGRGRPGSHPGYPDGGAVLSGGAGQPRDRLLGSRFAMASAS